MPDMSKPEYLTTDFINELKHRANNYRAVARDAEARAEEIDNIRHAFETRIDDHEKWKAKRAAEGGSK